ncbi:MAG: Bug family tripartite tricarboxylate transporter substrate binding protein, partial [Myxococcota bacterium]
LIVTHPTLPVKNLKELIALAKSRPGELNYATSGIGSPGHLATGLLESMTGIRMSHVPYKGGGPAMVDTIAGHVTIFTSVISTGIPFVQSGKVRGIAVTGDRRAEAIPNVLTVAEGGVKGYSATNWYGLMAPAKTPKNVIDRLNKELNAALRAPEIVQQLKDRGIDATPGTPEDYTNFIRAEDKKWTPLIKKLDIKDAS